MSNRKSVDGKTRKDILMRYGHCCAKCGRRKHLEIHHITLVINGGKDNYFNLIPLCGPCHTYAPDDYVEFLRYLGSNYTPQIEAIRKTAFGFVKFFHDMDEDEYFQFKQMSTEDFFKIKLEPLFVGLKKIVFGYEDDKDESEPEYKRDLGITDPHSQPIVNESR